MIQNEDGPQRTHSLDSGDSQTLKVSPTRKVLNLISYGKGGASEKVGNVINLHFEGNWMPLEVRCLPNAAALSSYPDACHMPLPSNSKMHRHEKIWLF